MSRSAPLGAPGEARNVLAITPFRRLWISQSLSSLGDWLGLLAVVSLAAILAPDKPPIAVYLAVSAAIAVKLAPAIVLSPLAGLLVDRLDRRLTMAVGDVLRALLYVSLPIVGRLDWLLVGAFLAEVVALFRTAAKDATVAEIVPKKRLAEATRVDRATADATAPVAAVVFAVLAAISTLLGGLVPPMAATAADFAVYAVAAAFLVAGLAGWVLPAARPGAGERGAAPAGPPAPGGDDRTEPIKQLTSTLEVPVVPEGEQEHGQEHRRTATFRPENVLRTLWDGMRLGGTTPLVRALLLGMLGCFVAGGAIVGVARIHVEPFGAGNAAFGVLFGAFFAGMALGLLLGPRVLRDFSRRRLFGLSVVGSGLALLLAGLIPNTTLAAVLTLVVGVGSGMAWAIGLTMLRQELERDLRRRTLAYLRAAARVGLMLSAVVAPLVAGAIGDYPLRLRELDYPLLGTGAVLMIAGVLTLLVGVVCYRKMSDSPDVSLLTELVAALRGVPATPAQEAERLPGTFIVLEGGEGSGKSTQVSQLAVWLRDEGFEVVATREPGATKLGMRLRALLLERDDAPMSPRAETLLYAADRANHVHEVVLPALRRGAIVVSDRYVDSTLAYQGAGRDLAWAGMARVNDWATEELVPHLTVLLDLPHDEGLERNGGPTDSMESEPAEFHARARTGFRELAEREPDRYLVLDAREGQEELTREIQRRLRPLLPDPVPKDSEAITGMMPIVDE